MSYKIRKRRVSFYGYIVRMDNSGLKNVSFTTSIRAKLVTSGFKGLGKI